MRHARLHAGVLLALAALTFAAETADIVLINGKVLTTPAVKVKPGDFLTVDGQLVAEREPTRICVVEASGSVADVGERIAKAVAQVVPA